MNKLILSFPRYGLCNKLITWAKALVWCENNGVRLIISGWTHIPLGSILRRDKSMRWYQGFFKGSKPLGAFFLLSKSCSISSIDDPLVDRVTTYCFKGTPYISDLPLLRNDQELIKREFFKMIKPRQLKLAENCKSPFVGMHIRRGDFIQNGGAVDLKYYISLIQLLREQIGKEVPVTIFSDGFKAELDAILKIPKVSLFESVNDLVDLLMLSKSNILITNLGSSYSYWAAFISEGIIIHHPSTWVPQCRPEAVNATKFEGKLEADLTLPADLIIQLKELSR